ncbi:CU044_5270 family protein [Spirillospora sp. CA-294931]|uniref:CU044_5270 family protein n=1 Tax=Spirillospora sp. CA-294931 TaxID=3240042 RepID=UPI003D9401F2
MDELTMVSELLTEERPASAQTTRDARRRLTTEISGRRRRPSRRGLVLVAGATAASLAVGVAYHQWTTRPLYKPEPLTAQSGPAANFLLAAANAKEKAPTDGRLWYVSSVAGTTEFVPSPKKPGTRYSLEVRQGRYSIAAKTENGLGKDWSSLGGELGDPEIRPVGPADERAWTADGRPGVSDFQLPCDPKGRSACGGLGAQERGPAPGEGAQLDFGVETARKLPTDPSKLRAWLLNYATKFDRRRLRNPDLYLFAQASYLLVESPVPDRVRVAVYRVMASLNGVRMITTRDADGRAGRAVAMRQTTPEHGTLDWQLVIDGSTGRVTATQAIVERPGTANSGLRPGTRQHFEVIKKSEWTNAPYKSLVPKWVRNLPEPG